MLTIFSIPKSFRDRHVALIQKNALMSWKLLHPDIEIMLMGTDSGVASMAAKLGFTYLPKVKTNQNGTPLLSSAFELARRHSRHKLLLYCNTDIILTSDLKKLIPDLPRGKFLLAGRRVDLDLNRPLNFNDKNWETRIRHQVQIRGKTHPPFGSDYFLFSKEAYFKLPEFLVGRVGWDNWLLHRAYEQGIVTIDASPVNLVIHQNHDHRHQLLGDKQIETNPEALDNLSLLSTKARHFTLDKSTHYLTPKGLKKRHRFSGNFLLLGFVIVFVTLRFQNIGAALSILKRDLLDERSLSYDQKMLRLRGPSYIYLKHVTDITPKNSVICLADQKEGDLGPSIAAYYLYPRTTSMLPPGSNSPKNCETLVSITHKVSPDYLMLYQGFPPFSVKAKRIYLFDKDLDGPVKILDNRIYRPNDPLFNNQQGLIEL